METIRVVDHDIAVGVWPDMTGPAYGNQPSEWDAGCRFDFVNPDYR